MSHDVFYQVMVTRLAGILDRKKSWKIDKYCGVKGKNRNSTKVDRHFKGLLREGNFYFHRKHLRLISNIAKAIFIQWKTLSSFRILIAHNFSMRLFLFEREKVFHFSFVLDRQSNEKEEKISSCVNWYANWSGIKMFAENPKVKIWFRHKRGDDSFWPVFGLGEVINRSLIAWSWLK